MKTIKQIGFLFLATAISSFTLSCSSESSDGGGGGSAEVGTIVAKVGGANFKSMEMATSGALVSVGEGKYVVSLTGVEMSMTGGGSKSISLYMNGIDLEPKSYDVGGDNLVSIVGTYIEMNGTSQQDITTNAWVAPSEGGDVVGKITISEISTTKIIGTFQFTAQKQDPDSEQWINDFKEVTNGAFNIELVQH